MKERIRKLLVEIEDINNCIQAGATAPVILSCFKDASYESMDEADRLTTEAGNSLEKLSDLMKDEK